MITKEQWVEFVASRRSTRDFKNTPVADAIIDELLTDALTAPSWSNTRPFVVAVATGDKRDRIAAEFLKRWDSLSAARTGGLLPKIRLVLTRYGLPTSNRMITRPYQGVFKTRSQKIGRELYGMLGVERGDSKGRDAQWRKNYNFFGAPVELFIFTHKSIGKYAASDASLFMQNLILGAHARGLGTCAQGAVAIWEDAVKAEFEVPAGYKLLYGVAVGYPSDAKVNTFQADRIDPSEIKLS